MARQKVRNPTVICDASDSGEICDIDIEVKASGVDLEGLSSIGKAFRANGREHSMSRFGSWVFQGSSASDQAKQVCIDGGIIASLTWGLLLSCPKAEIWVKNVEGCCFTMQLPTDQKQPILEYIAKGNLAKDLQLTLRERIPHIYKQIRIRLIKILVGSESTGREKQRISKSMQIQNYELAYAGLKRMMESKIGISERVHVLVRMGICCFRLKKTDDGEDIVKSLLQLTEKMEDCSPPLDTFIHDISGFANQLTEAEWFMYSLNVLLVAHKIIRKIEDPDDRLDGLEGNLQLCFVAMIRSLAKQPMIKLKAEYKQCLGRLENEVQYIKTMEGCDELRRSRSVYYTLHELNILKARLGEPVSNTAEELSVMRFSCAESSWADFTRVTSLGSQYQEIAPLFDDVSFTVHLKEISDDPALLEKRYADPRIRMINTLLNQNFSKATPMSGFTRKGIETLGLKNEDGTDLLKNRKEKAKTEKEKGDDAFDKMEFEKALRHYNKAIKIDPSDALHHCDKAEVFIRQHKLDEATKSCSTALRIVQSDVNADEKDVAKVLAKYANVEFLNKRFVSAVGMYRDSLSLNDDVEVRQQMSICLGAFLSTIMNSTICDQFNI